MQRSFDLRKEGAQEREDLRLRASLSPRRYRSSLTQRSGVSAPPASTGTGSQLQTSLSRWPLILIGRLGQNAEAKIAQNNRDYAVLNLATQESWKNDKGEFENRTEWHRVYAWGNLSKFARTLQKGQLITLEGKLRYRDVEDEVEGTRFRHRIAEIHAISLKRRSKVETADDPTDFAVEEFRNRVKKELAIVAPFLRHLKVEATRGGIIVHPLRLAVIPGRSV